MPLLPNPKTGRFTKKQLEQLKAEGCCPCLGWCGGWMKPKFRHDRFCTKCKEKKRKLEEDLSFQEETPRGKYMPSGFHPHEAD